MSPRPKVLPCPGTKAGCQTSGDRARDDVPVLLTSIRITGWMFKMFCVPDSGPTLKLVLFWNGTLTRLPTGFCASLPALRPTFRPSVGAVQAKGGGTACRPTEIPMPHHDLHSLRR